MKKLATLIFCLISTCTLAQVLTTVTATLTDSTGQVWSQAQWTTTFIPPFANPSLPNNQGHPVSKTQSGIASTSGAFTVSLDDNNVVAPAGSKWKFTICPNASVVSCTEVQLIITGSSMDISTALNTAISSPVVGAQPTIVRAYKDSEVNGSFGVFYSNVIDNTLRQCQLIFCSGTGWVIISGGGGTGTTVQVNGVTATSPANFNNTTPAAPINALNTVWQLSGGSISSAIQGDGISSDCFIGTAIFAPCPGGATGTVSGSGSPGFVAQWVGTSSPSTTLGNSFITSNINQINLGTSSGQPFLTPVGGGPGLTSVVHDQTPNCAGTDGAPPTFGCRGTVLQFAEQSPSTAAGTAVTTAFELLTNSNNTSVSGLDGLGLTSISQSGGNLTEQASGYFLSISGGFANQVTNFNRGLIAVARNNGGASPTAQPQNEAFVAQTGLTSNGAVTTLDYTMHCLAPFASGGTMTTHACLEIDPQATGVEMQLGAHTFGALPACTSTYEGSLASITDVAITAGVVGGGGTTHALLHCTGSAWVVVDPDIRDFSFTGCVTAQSTDSSCTGTVTITPAYANASYFPQLTINSNNGAFLAVSVSGTLSAGSFPYTITCTFNCSVIVAPTIYVHTRHL